MGNPVRLILTEGQAPEYGQASWLVRDFEVHFILADKGYDSDAFIEEIKANGASPVIPPKINRLMQRDYDKTLYKERNLVERFFQKVKHFRRIATRYERLAINYASMLYLVSTIVWLA